MKSYINKQGDMFVSPEDAALIVPALQQIILYYRQRLRKPIVSVIPICALLSDMRHQGRIPVRCVNLLRRFIMGIVAEIGIKRSGETVRILLRDVYLKTGIPKATLIEPRIALLESIIKQLS